ncbi:MAG: hypothetical protein HZB55_00375 [Deltaproteobacteria bacterium]|nr:hypothetical protein [Deltaproteobacteria bacterium]
MTGSPKLPGAARPAGRDLGRWAARAFVVVSVVAAFAPMRRYASRLDRDSWVLWAAAVVWTLSLPAVFVLTLWFAARWLDRGRRGKGSG